jgi:hypothetical protein
VKRAPAIVYEVGWLGIVVLYKVNRLTLLTYRLCPCPIVASLPIRVIREALIVMHSFTTPTETTVASESTATYLFSWKPVWIPVILDGQPIFILL